MTAMENITVNKHTIHAYGGPGVPIRNKMTNQFIIKTYKCKEIHHILN